MIPKPAAGRLIAMRRLVSLAWPLVVAQLAFLGMHTVDAIVAGNYSAEALAAVAVGTSMVMAGFTFFLGICLGISPGVAQRIGAGAGAQAVGEFAAAGVVIALVAWMLWGLALLAVMPELLPWLGLEPRVEAQAAGYIRAMALGTPGAGLFFALRNLIEGCGQSRPIMWLGFAALGLNLVLDLMLVRGFGPVPALGATGCGLATAAVQTMLGLAAWAVVARGADLRAYRPRGWASLRRDDMLEVVRVGAPVALALFAEHAIFAVGGLLMARYGTADVAGNQVALNIMALAFMIGLGLSQATAVRVGHAAGRGDRDAVRAEVAAGYSAATSAALLVALVFVIYPGALVGFYSDDPEVLSRATVFIRIAGVFHLIDVLQVIGAGALRGLKDSRAILAITLPAYWLVGVPLLLAGVLAWGWPAQSIWWIYALALGIAAVGLAARLVRLLRARDNAAPAAMEHPR